MAPLPPHRLDFWREKLTASGKDWVAAEIAACKADYESYSEEKQQMVERYDQGMKTDTKRQRERSQNGPPTHNLSFPTPDELRSTIETRSSAIVTSWKKLNRLLFTHELTIRKRWTKKSGAKKRNILTDACPDMSKYHNTMFKEMGYCNKKPEGGFQDRPNYKISRQTLLWPQLNLEDLSQPVSLLQLINARGRNHPKTFVAEDARVVQTAFNLDVLSRAFLWDHQILFDDDMSRPYATLHSHGRLEAGRLFQALRGMSLEGTIVLEVQEKILAVLVSICELILHDVDNTSLSDSSTEQQPEPPSLFATFNVSTGDEVALRVIAAIFLGSDLSRFLLVI